jgi:hypothetical protein
MKIKTHIHIDLNSCEIDNNNKICEIVILHNNLNIFKLENIYNDNTITEYISETINIEKSHINSGTFVYKLYLNDYDLNLKVLKKELFESTKYLNRYSYLLEITLNNNIYKINIINNEDSEYSKILNKMYQLSSVQPSTIDTILEFLKDPNDNEFKKLFNQQLREAKINQILK